MYIIKKVQNTNVCECEMLLIMLKSKFYGLKKLERYRIRKYQRMEAAILANCNFINKILFCRKHFKIFLTKRCKIIMC